MGQKGKYVNAIPSSVCKIAWNKVRRSRPVFLNQSVTE